MAEAALGLERDVFGRAELDAAAIGAIALGEDVHEAVVAGGPEKRGETLEGHTDSFPHGSKACNVKAADFIRARAVISGPKFETEESVTVGGFRLDKP